MIDVIIYVINNMDATLDEANVLVINEVTELNYPPINGKYDYVTYQMLHDDRKESLGMAYGYFKNKNSVPFWVLPSLPIGLVIKEGNTDIVEYTEEEYIKNIEPLWDVEDIDL